MDTIRSRTPAIGLMVGLMLVGCGAGRTMVMEPPTERRSFAAATVENGTDTVTLPEEFRQRLTQKVQEGLYGTAEESGSFKTNRG